MRLSAGFGLETLGLVSIRYPRASLLLVVLVTALSFMASINLEVSSDVRDIFKSDGPAYVVLSRMTEQYSGSELEALLVVENLDSGDTSQLQALRDLHIDLRFVEGVNGVASIFSARRPPNLSGEYEPYFPADLSILSDPESVMSSIAEHPLAGRRLLSDDLKTTLFVIGLESEYENLDDLGRVIGDIRNTVAATEAAAFQAELTGLPAMRLEVISTLIRDQFNFKLIGFVFGLAISWLVFRRFDYIALVTIPVVATLTWVLGGMWLAGQSVNVLTTVVPTLVMVIAYSDSLHLTFAIRRKLQHSVELRTAVEQTVREVGPACVLTSLTTALALLSLALVSQDFIKNFAMTAAVGTVIAFLTTMLTLPGLAVFLLRNTDQRGSVDPSITWFTRTIDVASLRFINLVLARPYTVGGALVGVTLVCGYFYLQNETQYRYSDQLPHRSEENRALAIIDSELAGANTVNLFMEWDRPVDLLAPAQRSEIRRAEAVLSSIEGISSTLSLASVEGWLEGASQAERDAEALLRELAEELDGRLYSSENASAIVYGFHKEMASDDLIALVDNLEKRLSALTDSNTGLRISVSGISPFSAVASNDMIRQLNFSLLTAILTIVCLIGVALRSVYAVAVSVLPNLLPITIAGAYLYATGSGLQFSSVIAFTVGFGIAVDSTIHILVRYRDQLVKGEDAGTALRETFVAIGPVLIFTTLVLAAGMSATMFSAMPMVKLYGAVTVLIVFAAVLGDMFLLPAIMRIVQPVAHDLLHHRGRQE